MRTRLVVNADDLGLHPALDAGILDAHARGIVTSTTLLVTGPTALEASRAATSAGMGVGVHLALCGALPPAAPLERVPTVAPGGRLRRAWWELARDFLGGRVRRDEVEVELRAQIERAQALGVSIDHLDSHQHLHLLPGIRPIVERIADEKGLPLRWPAALPSRDAARALPSGALKSGLLACLARAARGSGVHRVNAIGVAESGRLTEARLLALVSELPAGEVELICHPGQGTPLVPEDPSWRFGWDTERAALTSPSVREALNARGVELVTYAALSADRRAT